MYIYDKNNYIFNYIFMILVNSYSSLLLNELYKNNICKMNMNLYN